MGEVPSVATPVLQEAPELLPPGGVALAQACRAAPALAGCVLERDAGGSTRLLAIHRAPGAPPPPSDWVEACQALLPDALSGAVAVKALPSAQDLYGQAARHQLAVFPLARWARPSQFAAFLIAAPSPAALAAARERIEIVLALLEVGDLRLSLGQARETGDRLADGIEVHAAVQRHARFVPAAMALCNEVAARWKCERAALGVLRGPYVHLRALSHAESFSRKTNTVVAIESAMEECLEQDVEVSWPSVPDAPAIDRAHRELATREGRTAVASFPLREGGEPRAVFLVERTGDRPLRPGEIVSIRLAVELASPSLLRLSRTDRWLGARVLGGVLRAGAAVVGPRGTGLKLLVLAVVAAAAVLARARGMHRVDAPFVLEADVQRVLTAPLDGFLESVSVEPGDAVEAGATVLATLSTEELRLQLAAARAEQAACLKQASAHMSDGDHAQEQISRAQADKVAARIDLLEHSLAQCRIVSPVAGTVVVGELRERVGAPVRRGEVLFEVAELDSLYVVAFVPDEDVGYLSVGQVGDLAAASFPTDRLRVAVDRIEPVAQVVDRRNVFRVRLRLDERQAWMRPGMEGVTRIEIGERSYAWIVSHRFVEWVRMTFWF